MKPTLTTPRYHHRRVGSLALAVLLLTTLPVATAEGAADEGADSDDHKHHRQMMAETSDGSAGSQQATALPTMTIPDTLLVDQDGREVRFYSDLVRGRVVAMNFIFTTCTTICPPMGANFSKLQMMLGDQVGRDFEMISVSVDPAVDTPHRLAAWAEKFDRAPGWTLVTGSKPDVDELLKALKVFTPDKTDHSPILLLGDDATGRWTRAHGLASPTKIAEMITDLIPVASEGEAR